MKHGLRRDASIFQWFAGTRGNDEIGWIQLDQFFDIDLVIAKDANVRAEFAKILNEVISKGVVVIN